VSDQQREDRVAVCGQCPDDMMVIVDGVMRCTDKRCGCYMDNPKNRKILGGKTEYEALRCERGHWDKIDKKYTEGR